MPEGAIAFANEPVIEVTGPVIEAQLVETFLVNQVNLQTLLASKASRVVHAARGRTVVDFAARRTHGTEAADRLARLSYMVGFAGTSNVLAGGQYEVPTFGTMAHSFVTAFDDETEAFRAYARSFPDSSTFLVDTYDTLEGVRSSITVAKEMAAHGHALRAVRLDSGNLTELARTARAMLDEAGLQDVEVLASGGLDELAVDELVNSGAPLDGFGVGTKVGAVADAPDGEAVYKMVAYDGNPVLKLSAAKATLPGPKQVFRKYLADGRYAGGRDRPGIRASFRRSGLAPEGRHAGWKASRPDSAAGTAEEALLRGARQATEGVQVFESSGRLRCWHQPAFDGAHAASDI